jgi:WD40 repeat protein
MSDADVWDVESGEWIGAIEPWAFPFDLCCSPDGSKVVIDIWSAIYIHDAVTLEEVVHWKVPKSGSSRIAWSPDGRLLARTDYGITARVYEVETGRQVAALRAGRVRLTSVAFAPDGLTFATGTADGRVRVWDVG